MKNMLFICFTIICSWVTNLHGQIIKPQVIPVSGGVSKAGAIKLSWTLGEPFGQSKVSGDIKITAGYHQPYGGNVHRIVTKTISPSAYCQGESISVPYRTSGYYLWDNVFTAQLSDSNGSFINPVVIGTRQAKTPGIINATIPGNTRVATGYRIRVISSSPVTVKIENSNELAIVGGPTDWYADADLDGYGNSALQILACAQPAGYVTNFNDCNDANPFINPIATEICNGLDDDCDLLKDEGFPTTEYFIDNDGDHFGTTSLGYSCPTLSTAFIGGDCDDANPTVYPASPDTSFSTSIHSSTIHCIVQQTDGKIIIGGLFGTTLPPPFHWMGIDRFNIDGTRDASFNTGTGFLTANVKVMALQPDGKILVGGGFLSYKGISKRGMVRLFSDGTFDTNFNNGGSHLGSGSSVLSFAMLPDNKIIVGGAFRTYNGIAANNIMRLNTDGTRDNTFGGVGINWDNASGNSTPVYTLALQPDGKIIAAGDFSSYDNIPSRCIVRINSNGSIDNTFDSHGGTFDSISNVNSGVIYASALQPDGKIIIGGAFLYYHNTPMNRIARLNTDGSIDTSFHIGTGFNIFNVFSIKVQDDGKIVVSGNFTAYNGSDAPGLLRLHSDGSRDITFLPTDVMSTNSQMGILLQSDGKIVTGTNYAGGNGVSRKLVRLNNCNEPTTIFYHDADGDGFGNPNDSISSATQPPGFVLNHIDCNDSNNSIHTSIIEVCNGIDDDCDGLTDNADPSVTGRAIWFADADHDGYGNPAVFILACNQPPGSVSNNDDCNDSVASIHPGAEEICGNGIDDNCDGEIDDGCVTITLHLKAFSEGYYIGNGQMYPFLYNFSTLIYEPNMCDSLTIELHETSEPYELVVTSKVMWYTDGNALAHLPTSVSNKGYYIAIRPNNSIETWSKNPVLFNGSNIYFDFTTQ